jgi:hypothetical protein
VNLVDEQDGHRPLRKRRNHRLETLLEVTTESRACEQRAGVQRENFRSFEQFRDVFFEQARGKALGQRGFSDSRVADEDRVVLAAAAEDLHRPLQLVGPANQRIEFASFRASGEIGGVRAERIARACAAAFAAAGLGIRAVRALALTRIDVRRLGDSVSDVLQHVEPRDPVRGEQLRRVRLVLLQRCRQHVTRLNFLPPRALHVQHCRLQDPPERKCLLRLFLLAARELLDLIVEVAVEIATKLRQIGAARRKNPLTVLVVRQGVEQVLQCQVRMPSRRRLTIGDGQDDF